MYIFIYVYLVSYVVHGNIYTNVMFASGIKCFSQKTNIDIKYG